MEGVSNMESVCFFLFSWRLATWYKAAKKPVLLIPEGISKLGETISSPNRIDIILARCPSLHSVYYPSFCFMNPHLQMVQFMLNCHLQEHYLRPFTWVTELVTLSDGEQVALDWAGEIPSADPHSCTPVLMLHHGAGGRSSDLPGQTYIREALQRGWLVCALNRRGHKPGLPLSRSRWNFFGSTDDLRHVISEVVRGRRPRSRLVMLGISAGSGLVARYMGEQGQRQRQRQTKKEGSEGSAGEKSDSSFCHAAVGVCAGFNIEKCFTNVGFPYSWGLLWLQKMFLRRNESVLGHRESYGDALEATDLQCWLDKMWSIGHENYGSSDEYYAEHNPMHVTEFVSEPCLFLNAEDDPLCALQNVHDAAEDGMMQGDMNVAVVLTKTGSHCCFHELGTMLGHTTSWSERASFEFFDSALRHSKETFG